MFLQVLGSLEGFATKITLMRLQRYVNANVRGNVVTLDRGGMAAPPRTGEAEIVGALASHMTLTDMFLETLGVSMMLATVRPRLT